ncbi:hypothetical protein Q6D67_20400 [Haliea sp. E1-2-M8]|uniref:hypothetical protein n=1 Tax=Haliea sp. E1-2-M8 TaxID=3064706 RepID=UPI002715CB63|nr:hypothetical protein [Haliea sp. E1-2-M8]MDO8864052.1 hypothetical protein [Haliea sp. E1-2-M8]
MGTMLRWRLRGYAEKPQNGLLSRSGLIGGHGYGLIVVVLVLGASLGFGAGLLVADHWSGGREVIFIPVEGRDG